MGKTVLTLFLVSDVFDQILFILAGNDDIRQIFEEFEILSDPTTDYEAAFEPQNNSPQHLNVENGVATFSLIVFDSILFIPAGDDDIHKSLDEFEIQPDLTTD